jgi:hypothetical protein
VAFVMLVACGSRDAAPPDDPAVALGSVSSETSVPCPAGAASGATCASLVVACAGMDDLGVVVASSDPPTLPMKTIVLHNYVGGTDFFDEGFVDAYHAAGFRVVQPKWSSDWETSTRGLRHAACRYATLLQWIAMHDGNRARAFCAQSWGGGSGGLVMSLAHYGTGDVLDAITVSGGPPFSRVDLGCDPTSPPRNVCGKSFPVAYSGGPLGAISGWEMSPSCGKSGADGDRIARWNRDSILSDGATLAYPKTSIAAWYCDVDADPTVGQGSLFLDAVTSEKAVHCTNGCTQSRPWPPALSDMVADMRTRCIPHH